MSELQWPPFYDRIWPGFDKGELGHLKDLKDEEFEASMRIIQEMSFWRGLAYGAKMTGVGDSKLDEILGILKGGDKANGSI